MDNEDPTGWKQTFTFDAESLRTMDVPSYLKKMIEKDQCLCEHNYDINIILSELLSNEVISKVPNFRENIFKYSGEK